MKEFYIHEGEVYEVDRSRLTEFLEKFPEAKKMDEPGKTIDSADADPTVESSDMGSNLEDGSSELPDNRGWFEQAMDAGAINADLYDNADAIFDINNTEDARKLTNSELQAYIDLIGKSKQSASEMEELNKFSKSFEKYNQQGENWLTSTIMAVKENGGVTGGGMKGFAQASIQSFRSMANKELIKESAAPTLTAAGGGVAAGAPGGPWGMVGSGLTYGSTAFFTSMNYGLETINTFNTLLEEEIANNPDKYKDGFTPESIRMVIADNEARTRIKANARKRGATIATVEGVTNLVGIKGSGAVLKAGQDVAGTVGKTAVKTAAGTTAVGAEIIGGGTGEYLGEKVIGRDASGLEIVLESMAMTPFTAAKDVSIAAVNQVVNRPSYQVNGTKVSKQAIEDYVNGAETAEEIANLNVKVDNDDAFAKVIHNKIVDTQLETQVNEKIEDPADRQKMVKLERQRIKAENDVKKKGIQAVPGADIKLERINSKMQEIVSKYVTVDGRKKAVRDRKKVAERVKAVVADRKFSAKLEFAKKHSALYDLEVDDTMTPDQIKKEYGEEASKSDGFIKRNKIIINKTVAKETGAVNVGNHELLHGILRKGLKEGKINKKLITDLETKFGSNNWSKVTNRIKQAGYTAKYMSDNPDEYLTLLSDAIANNEIKFDENVFTKIGDLIAPMFRPFGFRKIGFENANSTYEFLKEYNRSIHKGALSSAIVKETTGKVDVEGIKTSLSPQAIKKFTKEINDLGKQIIDEDGTKTNLEEKNIGNVYYKAEADNIASKIQEQGLLDGLILEQPHVGVDDQTFLNTVYTELLPHIRNYKPENQLNIDPADRTGLFGWINPQIGNKAKLAYNRITKGEIKAPTVEIGQTTKEGDIKIQIAAAPDAAMEAFETEDLSLAAQAKKVGKPEKQQYSELRRELGFETGGDMYSKVMGTARKSLIRAYEKGTPARNIQRKLRDSANLYLFKEMKNFLGTKNYIKNLKKFRQPIVKAVYTADLVQLERNVPDGEKVFTRFVRKLTSKQEVQDAVNRNLLPPSALNIIDKGTAVSLYEKIMPTENEFVGFFDQPAINPETGARSGLKGTRKDAIAKYLTGALSLDATAEVSQESEVIKKRQDLAALKGETIENQKDDLQTLADAIGRDINMKFSKSNAETDINSAINGIGDVNVYSQIKFSKSHRDAYEKRLKKNRPDLTNEQRKNAVESIFDFVDGKNIPNNKKAKFEKLALHYMANGYLILPEDGYKVIEAERLATIKKIDPFSVKNPNALIERYVDQVKATRTNPDKVKTFTNKKDLGNGVTVYDVEDSKQGQKDVRKVIDTHFGKKANPWCLAARDKRTDQQYGNFDNRQEAERFADEWKAKGYKVEMFLLEKQGEYEVYADLMGDEKTELDNAFVQWENYGKDKKIAFQNGKLIAFRDGSINPQWWDRMDTPTNGIVVRGKKDKDGFSSKIELIDGKENLLGYEKGTEGAKNGQYTFKNTDGVVVRQEGYKNGKRHGEALGVDSEGTVSKGQHENGYLVGEWTTEYNVPSKKAKKLIKDSDGNQVPITNITKDIEYTTYDESIVVESVYELEGKNEKTGEKVVYREVKQSGRVIDRSFNNERYLLENDILQDPLYYTGDNFKRYVKLPVTAVLKDQNIKNEELFGAIMRSESTAIKFSRGKNAVKFTLTELQIKKKLKPFIAKKINDARNEGNLAKEDFYTKMEGLLGKKSNATEAYDVASKYVKDKHGVDIIGIDVLDNNIKNYYIPSIRKSGKIFSVDWYKDLLKDVKGDIVKELNVINDYLANVGRPIRFGMVFNLTSNEKLMNDVYKEFGNKYKKYYELVPVTGGQKVMFKTKENGKLQDIELYQEITSIKANPENYVKIVNEQSIKAREWLNKLLDSNKSDGEKKAIIQLTSSGQRSPIRKLPKMGVWVKGAVKDLVLEHEITVNDIHSAIIDHIDGKIDKNKLNEFLDKAHVHVLPKEINKFFKAEGKTYNRDRKGYESIKGVLDYLESLNNKGRLKGKTDMFKFSKSKDFQKIDNAIKLSRSSKNPVKGITVLDFDDTLATTKSMIRFTRPDGTVGKLNAEQYASTYQELSDLGYKWDFSEFNQVVEGKIAPLFEKALKLQKKFGPKDMFILTARPTEAAPAIHAFLKANGLNIPLKNITGLANSTSEAKALWMAEKVGEGYNDFYFADDALQNVQAVKNMLNQFDVKSKIQQAKIKFSKNMGDEFNSVLERTTGVPASEIISGARAKKRGVKKGKYKFFVPPSAEDFTGLLYYFMGKGVQGDKDAAFFKKSLIDPLNKAYTELNAAKQSIANDFKTLKKQDKDLAKKLGKDLPDGDFTYGDAVRVYLWDKAGFDIPGLNKKDIDNLTEIVNSDPKLQEFAEKLGLISKRPEGYTKPGEYWQVGDIRNDLDDATGKIGRKEFFTEFTENSDIIFSEDNLNKIEAIYGSNFKEALEDILYRTKTGVNRSISKNRLVNEFTNWINGSVGTVMFFNARSAILQTLSTVNFINWGDNNIFKAAKAFANQPQYWKDFAKIFNSDKLKQRRAGLSMDINANELATYLNKSKSKPRAAVAWLLSKGFLPTQIADSFAISAGGATFYRNRMNTYLKQGLSQKEAEAKAWNDFSELSEATQQSARPDMVSQQQASPLGKWLLNFQNTPMQYARLMKKAVLDLVNRRGDTKANISRIIYYGAAQNFIFYSMQTALFAMMFGLEDDEDEEQFFKKKKDRVANSMVDGLLRGMGIAGGVVSTVKNMIVKFIEEDKKGWKGRPVEKVGSEFLNLSPVIGIKWQKIIDKPIRGYGYNKKVIQHMETFDIDNPLWGSVSSVTEGVTNVPLNRLYNKTQNLRAATRDDAEAWQRLALISGWSTWNIGMQNEEIDKIKEEIKELNKKKKKKKKGGLKPLKLKPLQLK